MNSFIISENEAFIITEEDLIIYYKNRCTYLMSQEDVENYCNYNSNKELIIKIRELIRGKQ